MDSDRVEVSRVAGRVADRVLLIADDPDLHRRVDGWLQDQVWLLGADSIRTGRQICAEQPVDVVVLAGDEDRLTEWLGADPSPDGEPIVFLTPTTSYEVALHALRSGAIDCLSLPLAKSDLLKAVNRALKIGAVRQSAEIRGYRSSQERKGAVLIGGSDSMASVTRLIDLAGAVQAPVFITGETGTGKNVVASAIHYRSRVRHDVFLGINCGALAPNLIESELFG